MKPTRIPQFVNPNSDRITHEFQNIPIELLAAECVRRMNLFLERMDIDLQQMMIELVSHVTLEDPEVDMIEVGETFSILFDLIVSEREVDYYTRMEVPQTIN